MVKNAIRTRISCITRQQISPSITYLETAIDHYFVHLKYKGRPNNTIHAYKEKILPFLDWCNSTNLKYVTEISPDDLRVYFNQLSINHTPGGVHGYYRVIHAFFGWWENEYEEYFDTWKNPFRKAKMDKPKLDPLDPVDNKVVEALLATCNTNNFLDIRDKAIILILFDTGIRSNELVMLDQTDLGDHTLHIRFGKGRQVRYVHFGQSVKYAIDDYLRFHPKNAPPLILNDYGARIQYQCLRKIIERRSKIVNIAPPALHSFRRAFAINALLNGWDIYRLRDELGHNDLTVLQRYLKIVEAMRVDLSKMTSAADKLVFENTPKKRKRISS